MEFCRLFDQTGMLGILFTYRQIDQTSMHEILFTYRQMDWVKTGMLGILFTYRQVDQSSMYGILSTYRQMDRLKPVCLEFCAWQTCRWIDQRFLTMWLLTTTHHSYVHHHWPHGMGCILDCTTFGSVCQATKNTSAKIQTSHVYWKWKPYSPTMILLAYHKHPHSPANCFSFVCDVCVHVCARACMRACVRVCVCECDLPRRYN